MLIRAADLRSRLSSPDVIIFDCRHDLLDHTRGARVYTEGHLPGAHFAPIEGTLSGAKNGTNGRHPLPPPEAFAEFLRQHGVTPAHTLVAYDDSGGLYAARLWWMARWIGLERVALLDGGLPRWVAEGHPVSTERPTPQPAAAPLAVRVRADLTRSAADLLSRLHEPTALALDARAAERYRGENETIDPVAGHIPGAQNRFYKANLNADLTYRDPATLRAEFVALLAGRDPAQVTHYCGSGITACANLFAMELAGLTGSRIYPGSWSEWIADPSRPVGRHAQ